MKAINNIEDFRELVAQRLEAHIATLKECQVAVREGRYRDTIDPTTEVYKALYDTQFYYLIPAAQGVQMLESGS